MTNFEAAVNIDSAYAALGLPPDAWLGQRVPKKLFLEQLANHQGTTATDKKLIRERVEELRWLATLKPISSGLSASVSDTQEYLEIAILSLDTRARIRSERLVRLVHRIVPYPVVLFLQAPDSFSLSLAEKRKTLTGEAGKTVLQELRIIPLAGAGIHRPLAAKLLSSLKLSDLSLPSRTLQAAYSAWMALLVSYDSARWLGRYRRESLMPIFEASSQLNQHRAAQIELASLEREETILRNRLKGEKQLGRKVEWNTALKHLLERRSSLLDVLQSNTSYLEVGNGTL